MSKYDVTAFLLPFAVVLLCVVCVGCSDRISVDESSSLLSEIKKNADNRERIISVPDSLWEGHIKEAAKYLKDRGYFFVGKQKKDSALSVRTIGVGLYEHRNEPKAADNPPSDISDYRTGPEFVVLRLNQADLAEQYEALMNAGYEKCESDIEGTVMFRKVAGDFD